MKSLLAAVALLLLPVAAAAYSTSYTLKSQGNICYRADSYAQGGGTFSHSCGMAVRFHIDPSTYGQLVDIKAVASITFDGNHLMANTYASYQYYPGIFYSFAQARTDSAGRLISLSLWESADYTPRYRDISYHNGTASFIFDHIDGSGTYFGLAGSARTIAAVPLPAGAGLLGAALMALPLVRRRRAD